MVAGIPGTGIGGIFYLLLVIYMPVREFFRLLQKRTNLGRWGFIALQLCFVFGILAALWGEMWFLSRSFIWLQQTFGFNYIMLDNMTSGQFATERVKILTFAAASGGLISLAFIFVVVHILRLFVRRGKGVSYTPTLITKTQANMRNAA
jgi:hypothetical protein